MPLFTRAHRHDPTVDYRRGDAPASARPVRSLGLVAGITAVLALLSTTGPGLPLGAGLTGAARWTSWLGAVGPAVALMAVIREVALVLGGYLLVVAVLHLAATLTHSTTLATVARHLTVPAARRLIAGVTGAGLAMSITVAAVAPAVASASARPTTPVTAPVPPSADPGPNRTMVQTNPAYASGRPGASPTAGPGPGPNRTMVQTNPAYASGLDAPPAPAEAVTPAPPVDPSVDPSPPAPSMPGSGAWTIAAGDHLWRVAERTLHAAWGRPPRDRETAHYLDAIIRTNHDVLAVPGNPDLVFPGQVFALPVVPAA